MNQFYGLEMSSLPSTNLTENLLSVSSNLKKEWADNKNGILFSTKLTVTIGNFISNFLIKRIHNHRHLRLSIVEWFQF